VAIVTRVLAEQSAVGVRLLAGAHICLRRTEKGVFVGPTERHIPLAPEKRVPQLQDDFSPQFRAEVKNVYSWVRRSGMGPVASLFVFLGIIIRN